MVSPIWVCALKNAGQIHTGGTGADSSMAVIIPSSIIISTGNSASSSPRKACPDTIRGFFSWVVTLFYMLKNEIYLHGKETRRQITLIGWSRQLLRERRPAGCSYQSHYRYRSRSSDWHHYYDPEYSLWIASINLRKNKSYFSVFISSHFSLRTRFVISSSVRK